MNSLAELPKLMSLTFSPFVPPPTSCLINDFFDRLNSLISLVINALFDYFEVFASCRTSRYNLNLSWSSRCPSKNFSLLRISFSISAISPWCLLLTDFVTFMAENLSPRYSPSSFDSAFLLDYPWWWFSLIWVARVMWVAWLWWAEFNYSSIAWPSLTRSSAVMLRKVGEPSCVVSRSAFSSNASPFSSSCSCLALSLTSSLWVS